MKMRNIKLTGLFILILLLPAMAYPQLEEAQIGVFLSLPQIALLDIEPGAGSDIHFTVEPSAESGNPANIEKTTNGNLWVNYTSAVANPQDSRVITAQISQGNFPEGITLFVEAGAFSGSGAGQTGQPTGKTSLSVQPKPIISNIGSCFTGNGTNNGHLLTFSIDIADYSKIQSMENSEFTILYTITDN